MRAIAQRVLLASVGVERDRLRRTGVSARVCPARARSARELGGDRGVRARPGEGQSRDEPAPRTCARSRAARCGRPRTTRRSCSTSTAARSRRERMARYDDAYRGRPRDRRRRCGRRDARAAARAARAGRSWCSSRARSGTPTRLGLRRGRLAQALLDRGARHRRQRSGRARQEQLGPRRRRLDGPLRRLLPALSPLRLRDADTRRGRRGLADLLRRAQAPLRAARARAAGRGRALAVGRPAPLSARPASDRGRRRGRPWAARAARHRDARRPGRHHERRVRQPAALHLPRLLPAGLQGEREGLAARHPHPRRDRARRRDPRRLHGQRDRGRRRERARHRRAVRPRRRRARAASRRGRGRRLLDRDAAAAPELDQPPLPARACQRQRPGRPLRDGAGRAAGRGPLPRRAADVQGAAAGDLLRAVLRDRPAARLRPGLLDPDGRAAADRAGPSTCSPTATGVARCASTCATTTTGTRSASSASCCRFRRTA